MKNPVLQAMEDATRERIAACGAWSSVDPKNYDKTLYDTAHNAEERLRSAIERLANLAGLAPVPPNSLVMIDYTNHQLERGFRTIAPHFIRFGTTPHHAEPQWLLEAVDREKGPRTYSIRDIHAWTPYYLPKVA